MMDEGKWVDPACFDAAKEMMAEAEEASRRSCHAFTSYWTRERQNAFGSTEASMFEMVLQKTLEASTAPRSQRSWKTGPSGRERARTRAVLRRPLRAREGGGKGGRGGSGGGFHHGWRPGKGMHYQ